MPEVPFVSCELDLHFENSRMSMCFGITILFQEPNLQTGSRPRDLIGISMKRKAKRRDLLQDHVVPTLNHNGLW